MQKQKLITLFKKNPQALRLALEQVLTKSSPYKLSKSLELLKEFATGSLSWRQICGLSQAKEKAIAQKAFFALKQKNYKLAYSYYRALTLLDHQNWSYRGALGAIYKLNKKYKLAIDEFSLGLLLKENEPTLYISRAECHIMQKQFAMAKKDLDCVLKLSLAESSPWRVRAKSLQQRLKIFCTTANGATL